MMSVKSAAKEKEPGILCASWHQQTNSQSSNIWNKCRNFVDVKINHNRNPKHIRISKSEPAEESDLDKQRRIMSFK